MNLRELHVGAKLACRAMACDWAKYAGSFKAGAVIPADIQTVSDILNVASQRSDLFMQINKLINQLKELWNFLFLVFTTLKWQRKIYPLLISIFCVVKTDVSQLTCASKSQFILNGWFYSAKSVHFTCWKKKKWLNKQGIQPLYFRPQCDSRKPLSKKMCRCISVHFKAHPMANTFLHW